ncbi:hydrogenase 3 maturation endopeptidase HyCI [Pelotomaculum propionicicum]|uniref:Hydrogenase 3 maturation protease n=1 Tax=Pelotomaculum propionicicum TaxID=258475 RepID=A0A4Y7RS55_9FIRM|nr:hydrogenase 3 maturation endopeptidase HyCI [Pelotomaculum propionicicum]TEB11828.1 Hydrogenase 3 maturation protease [Pelotomaculum propionicicum]
MLASLSKRLKGRVFLVGIGNILRGDDAAGPLLIERLAGKVKADLLDASEVPESYIGRIAGRRPDTIMLVDAADMGADPGAIAIIEIENLREQSFSSHQMGLNLFMRCLQTVTGADVFLLGIQPRVTGFGAKFSPKVAETIHCLEEFFMEVLAGKEEL